MSDITFANGMIIKDRGAAPEYVIAKVSIKVDEFIQTLQEHSDNGWLNIEIKQAKSGKNYASIDKWKPNSCTGYTTKVQAPQAPAPFPTQEPDNFPGLEAGSEETPDIPF